MDVTAIVPTFNRMEYLPASLEVLLAQTRPLAEIIVIDDGSSDGTTSVLERFGRRIRPVRQANAGKAAALNHALRLATGDAVWIVDDDDLAAPDAAEWLAGALENDPAAGFAFGNFDQFSVDDAGTPWFNMPEPFVADVDDLYWQTLKRCSLFQGAMLVRRSCYDEVGTFDESMLRSEDYEMLLRLTRRYRSVYVDRILFHQRRHPGLRGPSQMRLDGAAVERSNFVFDALAIRKAYDRSDLADFMPRSAPDRTLGSEAECRALLRRSAAMGQRSLWDIAGRDLAAALAIADEAGVRSVSRDVLDVFSQCFRAEGQDGDCTTDNPLLRAISATANPRLRRELLAALSWQLLLSSLKSVMRRKGGAAMQKARRYLRLTHGRYLGEHLGYLFGWAMAAVARRQRRGAFSPRRLARPLVAMRRRRTVSASS